MTDPSYAEQLVCFTAPMVGNYGVADGRGESARPHGRAASCAAGRRGVGAVAELPRDRRARGDRHPCARPAAPRGRSDARAVAVADEEPLPADDALEQVRTQPSMEGQALVAGVSVARAVRLRRGRRPGVAVVDYGTKRSILSRLAPCRRRRHRPSAHGRRRRPRRLRRRRPLERPGRSGAARGRGRDGPRPARDDSRARHLPRPPTAGPGDRPPDVQAPVRPSWREPSGPRAGDRACPRDEPEPRVRGRAVRRRREATHVSLYDGTVEGLDFPDLRARSVQFHPEAGPGPHDAWPIIDGWVEGLARG